MTSWEWFVFNRDNVANAVFKSQDFFSDYNLKSRYSPELCKLYYMTGVFPHHSLVDSWSRGVQYVVILHGVQYVMIFIRDALWRVW